MIAIILVFVIYYITLGIITSYLGSKIFKRANMKVSFIIKFIYGLFWPVFIKHIIPGIKDIICKDAVERSVKEMVEYIEKREEIKDQYLQQIMQQQNPGQLVGNSVTPENIEIPEDAIPIKEDELVGINKILARNGYNKYVFMEIPEDTIPIKEEKGNNYGK